MCGLYGFLDRRGKLASETRTRSGAAFEATSASLASRGPDDADEWLGGPCLLGHRRLAIIDRTPTGRQPLVSPDGRIHVVVNGEIYNAAELVARPGADRYLPPGRSDARAIFAAYGLDGADFAAGLEGMFALALWDADRDVLILARDRAGEKPLFWTETDAGLLFASTLPALLPHLSHPRLDAARVPLYLLHNSVPAPHTLLADVQALPPGHVLRAEGPHRDLRSYASSPGAEDPEAARPSFREALDQAVARRLTSDVPLGVLLSGGLDSAAVLESASRQLGTPLPSFTMGFSDPTLDERERAGEVARALGGEHHTFRFTDPDGAALADHVIDLGEPLADSSALAFSALCREVGATHRVTLGGDGGDELLGGYDRYRAVAAASRPLTAWLLRALAPFARGRRGQKLRALAGGNPATPASRLLLTQANGAAEFLDDLLPPGVVATARERERSRYESLYDSLAPFSALQRVLVLDRLTNLPTDLLTKVDRASMAHGVEVRSPFLDHRLTERMLARMARDPRYPPAGKGALRAALGGRLPAACLRGRKRGFGVPLERLLREGALGRDLRDRLASRPARERGLFVPEAVTALWGRLERREGLAAELLYAIAVLELWCHHHGVAVG